MEGGIPLGNKPDKFDYKKEYKEFYLPPKTPGIITIPEINYLSVQGKGDPNEPEGEYKAAVGMLYAIAFTIKMSGRAGHKMDGYFSYVVPPLEGLWKMAGNVPIDYAHKENFEWRAMIRLPEFVTEADFVWAQAQAAKKAPAAAERLQLFRYTEGLCVQCLHVGSYDDEPATLAAMRDFAAAQGYAPDLTAGRRHHEIYLSDPRRCKPENLKTVIRLPIKKR